MKNASILMDVLQKVHSTFVFLGEKLYLCGKNRKYHYAKEEKRNAL